MTTPLRKPNEEDKNQEHPNSASTGAQKKRDKDDSPKAASSIAGSTAQASSMNVGSATNNSNATGAANPINLMPEPQHLEFKQAPMTLIGSN